MKAVHKFSLLFAVMASAMFFSCSKSVSDHIVSDPVADPEAAVSSGDLYFRIGLNDSEVATRLTYNDSRSMIKTKWEEDDVIYLNGQPSTSNYSYPLVLDSGAGTNVGTFRLSGTYSINSYVWALYFPGDRIREESDFLKFSYKGQVQKGNSDLSHLKGYHSVRYLRSEDVTPVNINEMTAVDFSGGNVQQSGCMKFNLSGLDPMVPAAIYLEYINPDGQIENCFYTYNILNYYYGAFAPVQEQNSNVCLKLEGFERTTEITAYMMMSNADVQVKKGGKFRVTVVEDDGGRCYCDKLINADATLSGGELNTITCTSWTKVSDKDGMVDPANGVAVLHEKTLGNGTDIIIMGDGYSEESVGKGSVYEMVMKQAYADFFSVEPFASLKDYFNVYYINAVSPEEHDAQPHFSGNGAVQGDAVTVFNTQFTENTTHISGNDEAAVLYAMQAIRSKGGPGGNPCTDEYEVYNRAHKALIIVMVNVPCHAGTCYLRSTYTEDYGNSYSVAYSAVNSSDDMRKWTMIHEAGGHGFGKLLDEYVAYQFVTFDTGLWDNFIQTRNLGVGRNIDKYWGSTYPGPSNMVWGGTIKENAVEVTTASNVYWKSLIDIYASEETGVYEGANTYSNFYCRSTPNSIMNDQFSDKGQFFNAISRWAIWYRLMRLTGMNVGNTFESSLAGFLSFDSGLTAVRSSGDFVSTRSLVEIEPSAPPVVILGNWENGTFIE